MYTFNGTSNNGSVQVVSVPANQSSFSIEIQKGIEYTVSVFGENVLGNGSIGSSCKWILSCVTLFVGCSVVIDDNNYYSC